MAVTTIFVIHSRTEPRPFNQNSGRARARNSLTSLPRRSSDLLNLHGGAVAEYFRDADCDLGCVVAHADDGVGADLARVCEHALVRVVARVLERAPELSASPIVPPPGLESSVEGARFRLFPDARVDGFTAHLMRRS